MEFLLDGPGPARRNMQRDLDLLRRARPALRLYGWSPAAVSVGRGQRDDVVDEERARGLGLDHVRRPTGGGALLHDEHEVTYAVVLPHDFPGLPGDVAGSYTFVTRPLLAALRGLGVRAELASGRGDLDDLCYLRREGVHVTVGGRKISGGAQRRTGEALLQHGTLLVRRDAERMARVFGADPTRIRATTTSLEDEGATTARPDVEAALVQAYREAWTPLVLA